MQNNHHTTLQQTIAQATVLAKRLLGVLLQEFEGLKDRDAEIIQAMSKQKNELLQQVQQNHQATEALLQQITPPIQDSDEFLSTHDIESIRDIWHEYKTLLAEGNRQNQINGQIIAVSKAGVERSLAILRGQQPDGSLYSASGKSIQLGSGQNTIKA